MFSADRSRLSSFSLFSSSIVSTTTSAIQTSLRIPARLDFSLVHSHILTHITLTRHHALVYSLLFALQLAWTPTFFCIAPEAQVARPPLLAPSSRNTHVKILKEPAVDCCLFVRRQHREYHKPFLSFFCVQRKGQMPKNINPSNHLHLGGCHTT